MKQNAHPWKLRNLALNLRFYIVAQAILLSVIIMAYLRIQISVDQLYFIRLEQVYGLISTLYLYFALLVSPLLILPLSKNIKSNLKFSRRGLGVSAALFALLHTLVALFGQFGGFSRLSFLPPKFIWSISIGGVAAIILTTMALLSFDKAVKFMSFSRWKWIQRLVYFAALGTIAHVRLIGTHLAYVWIQRIGFLALALLFIAESIRCGLVIKNKFHLHRSLQMIVTALLIAISIASLIAFTKFVSNYHADQHTGTGQIHGAGHE